MSGLDIFCDLSYVDDMFVAEAKPGKLVKKNNTVLFAACSVAAAAVIICAIMMAFFFKGGFSDRKQPLTQAGVPDETETQITEEEIETEAETEMELGTIASRRYFKMSRDFSVMVYGYAGEMVVVADPERREKLCYTIEEIPMRRATEEEKAEYNEMEGHYPFAFGKTMGAMTSKYFMIGNSLYCFKEESGFERVKSAIESVAKSEKEKVRLVMVSEEISQEILTYAKTAAVQYIPALLEASELFQIEYEESGDFYIGNGYRTYYREDGEIKRGDVIDFPVIQNGQVVMMIHTFVTPQGWQASASAGISEQLNAVIGDGNIYQAIAPYPDANSELVRIEATEDALPYSAIEVISEEMKDDKERRLCIR